MANPTSAELNFPETFGLIILRLLDTLDEAKNLTNSLAVRKKPKKTGCAREPWRRPRATLFFSVTFYQLLDVDNEGTILAKKNHGWDGRVLAHFCRVFS
jgi:hypothetical protein